MERGRRDRQLLGTDQADAVAGGPGERAGRENQSGGERAQETESQQVWVRDLSGSEIDQQVQTENSDGHQGAAERSALGAQGTGRGLQVPDPDEEYGRGDRSVLVS